MLQNDSRGFPSYQKKHPYQKHVKMEEGSRKLRDSTGKNDSFAINLLPPKNTYIYTRTPHACAYVHMYARCVCVHVCVLQMCAYAELCATCVCGVCVCVQKRKRDNYYKLSSVCTYTPQCMYMHTHKTPLRLQENSTVQGYATAND